MKRRIKRKRHVSKKDLKKVRDFFNIGLKDLRSIFGDDRAYRIFYKNKLIGKLVLIIKGEDEY